MVCDKHRCANSIRNNTGRAMLDNSVQEADTSYQDIVDWSKQTKPSRIAVAASEHVSDQAQRRGGGARADVLQVSRNSTGNRSRGSASGRGSRASGSGAIGGRGSSGSSSAASGNVRSRVEGTTCVLNVGGAVAKGRGVAHVVVGALRESLLADEL